MILIDTDTLSLSPIDSGEVYLFRDKLLVDLPTAIEASEDEVAHDTVLSMLKDGSWQLFILSDEYNYKGFAITENIYTEHGVWLNIPFMYSDGDLRALNFMSDQLEKYAQIQQYRGVKLITTVNKLQRYATRRGYKQRFVELVNEF